MSKRVVFGGMLAFLAACGGAVDSTGTGSSGGPLPAPSRDAEQGIYQPATVAGPEHVADGLGSPSAIAMTEDRVIFTTRFASVGGERVEAGALYVADKRVGPALLLTIDRRGASFDALATDAEQAFLATSDGRLLGVPVAGGTVKTLATLAGPAVALVPSGNYVYFATHAGALGRVAKSGGDVELLATIPGAIRSLQADDAAVYVATGATEQAAAGIVRVAFGGTVSVLTSGAEPCAMIRDGRSLYWTSLGAELGGAERAKGQVLRLALDGGNVATVASGSFSACAIAADESSLYFATTSPDALPVKAGGKGSGPTAGLGLMRAAIAGGRAVAVAQASHALTQPGTVAVDGTHIYWLTETAVLRLRK